MTRSLLLPLPLLLKPHPGEKGKEITKRDIMSPENIAPIVRYLRALLSGPYLDPYNYLCADFLTSFSGIF